MSGRRRVALIGMVVLVALGFLVVRALGDATLYFRTADEAVAEKDRLGDRRFRIQGTVEPGSVDTTRDGVRFRIRGDEVSVPVVHHGNPPDLFQPSIPVVLEGHWEGERFASDRIMVRHSEDYREDHPDRVEVYGER